MSKPIKFAPHSRLPIVLAVCGRDNVTWDELTLCQQLYGDIDVSFTRHGKMTIQLRHRGRGFSADKNTSISAILFCTRSWERSQMIHSLKVLHNPWAKRPLSSSIFGDIPQLLVAPDESPTTLRWQRRC